MVQRYPTDLTETEWTILAPLIPRVPVADAPETLSIPPDRLPLFLDLAPSRRLGADA
jgi:hypothetical protein